MIAVAVALAVAAASLPRPAIRVLIRDARAIVATEAGGLWPGMRPAVVEVDVIGGRREHLFCRAAAAGFVKAGRDRITGCRVLTRRRVLAIDLAASFDIVPGVQAIAIGTPAALEMDAAAWKLTLLHEAFHQYQAGLPGYPARVRAVRDAIGGEGDGWPLTWPFPYAEPAVAAAFRDMTAAALAFLASPSPAEARTAAGRYVAARRRAAAAAGPRAWRYYEFQVGQEGVARWTEIALAERAGRHDPALAALARDRRLGLAASLRAIDEQGLAIWKRSAFYALGAIEAEMLDRAGPGWRATYAADPFVTGDQLGSMLNGRN